MDTGLLAALITSVFGLLGVVYAANTNRYKTLQEDVRLLRETVAEEQEKQQRLSRLFRSSLLHIRGLRAEIRQMGVEPPELPQELAEASFDPFN